MPERPVKGVAIRTWRDEQRAKQTELLKSMYDRIDADIADALGDDDGTSQPQLR